MRFPKPKSYESDADLTPMIDMAFQLIAFFIVLINFSDAEQNERVKLPISELAKPPEAAIEDPVFLHLTRAGTVFFGGEEVPSVAALRPYLIREANTMERKQKSPSEATVIIRADAASKAGHVRELIRLCQDARFEKFNLRAEERLVPVRQNP